IEPEKAQQTPGNVTVTPDQAHITLLAQLLCIWRFAADPAQSRNATAFLIDGDDRFDFADVAQIIDKLSQLRGVSEIAAEKDKRAWLHPPKQLRSLTVQFPARNADHNQLTERIALHEAHRLAPKAQYSTAVILDDAKNRRSEMFHFASHDRVVLNIERGALSIQR